MNEFYKRKAAVPREARTGELKDRLAAWRDKRLVSVAAACGNTTDPFRKKFGSLHEDFVNTVNSILDQSDEEMPSLVSEWVEKLKISFKSQTGAHRDAVGLCGAELQSILSSYAETEK